MRLPRCRAVMKWAGAGLALLLALSYLASAGLMVWVQHTVGGSSRGLGVASGCATAYQTEWVYAPYPKTWSAGCHMREVPTFEWHWFPAIGVIRYSNAQKSEIDVPLYIPFTLLALPTTFLFYRDRRSVRWSREGRCVGCGYDLSGVPGKCPECGKGAA